MPDQTPTGRNDETSAPKEHPKQASEGLESLSGEPHAETGQPSLLEAMLAGGLPLESQEAEQAGEALSGDKPDGPVPDTEKSFERLVKEAMEEAESAAAEQEQSEPEHPEVIETIAPGPQADRVDQPVVDEAPAAEAPGPEAETIPTEEAAPKPRPEAPAVAQQPAGAAAPSPAKAKPEPPKPKARGKTRVAPIISGPMVVVRYGLMRNIGQFRHSLDPPPPCGTSVVVRTQRGIELGRVTACVRDDAAEDTGEDNRSADAKTTPCDWRLRGCMTHEELSRYVSVPSEEYPISEAGRVLRIANVQDIQDANRLRSIAKREATHCREVAEELKLDMKVIAVDHLLGGDRIIFYFASENRVDFRKLVQRLSSEYHTRIEMRQVGARDEARLVADYEKCGQQCCCQVFLKALKPVSMRMAKMQKASLDPTKISGRCGRLMCCMRYEDRTYEELRRELPKRKTWVRTAEVVGQVIDTQILTQLVRLSLPDGTKVAVGNEEIIDRNCPPAEPTQSRRTPPHAKRVEPAPVAKNLGSKPPAGQAAKAPVPKPASTDESGNKKRRRGRRRKKKGPQKG